VDVEKLHGGLEVRAGEAGVGVRAVLLRRAGAISVGQAVADPVEVLFDPLGIRGGSVGVVGDALSGDVDPGGLVGVEGFADGTQVELVVLDERWVSSLATTSMGTPWRIMAVACE
jgi:hypothetical protein